MKKLNLIGRQVNKLRQRNGWSQEEFAVQLQRAGWHNATRSTVSKIEGGSMGVAEYDLLFVAAALRVHLIHLYPEIDWKRPMDETVHKHIPTNCTASPLNLDQPKGEPMENIRKTEEQPTTPPTERLAYSIQEAADMLSVNYFSVYRLIQRGKLKVCRASNC